MEALARKDTEFEETEDTKHGALYLVFEHSPLGQTGTSKAHSPAHSQIGHGQS